MVQKSTLVALLLGAAASLSIISVVQCGPATDLPARLEPRADVTHEGPQPEPPQEWKDVGVDIEHGTTSNVKDELRQSPSAPPPTTAHSPENLAPDRETTSTNDRTHRTSGWRVPLGPHRDRYSRDIETYAASTSQLPELEPSCFKLEPAKFHCLRFREHSKKAAYQFLQAIFSLPAHAALGVIGSLVGCFGGIVFGCANCDPKAACFGLQQTVLAPGRGVVLGAAISVMSACITVAETGCALYELSVIPIAACKDLIKKPNEQDLYECKVSFDDWKDLRDESRDEYNGIQKDTAKKTLGMRI